MPEPIGDDRVLSASEGHVLLFTHEAKGWVARKAATQISAEHPGTAIIWEGEIWEVLEVDPIMDLGVQYRLAPWDSRHAIRLPLHYSQETEAAHAREKAARQKEGSFRLVMILLAPVSGLIPGHIQEKFAELYGLPRVGLTFASLVLPFIAGTFSVFAILAMTMAAASGVCLPSVGVIPLLFGVYLFAETLIRFGVAMTEGRPTGSGVAIVPYLLFCQMAKLFTKAPSEKPAVFAPDEDRHRIHDRYSMLEPFLSLLSEKEQQLLADRFGFSPIRWGRRTSLVLLALMFAQVLNSVDLFQRGLSSKGTVAVALILAISIGGEQIYRLVKLTQGEVTGSLLGALVRPLARDLFISNHETTRSA